MEASQRFRTPRHAASHSFGREAQSNKADANVAGQTPRCPDCGGPMWDNREGKASGQRNPRSPDFSCKRRGQCRGAIWLETAVLPPDPTVAPDGVASKGAAPSARRGPRNRNDPAPPQGAVHGSTPARGHRCPSHLANLRARAHEDVGAARPVMAAFSPPAHPVEAHVCSCGEAEVVEAKAPAPSALSISDRTLLEELASRLETRANAAERSDRIYSRALAPGIRDTIAMLDKILESGTF